MATLAASAVTINSRYNSIANTEGKRQTVDATLVLTGQGGLTNTIPASLLGLSAIDSASVVDSDSNQLLAGPSYDRTLLVLSTTSATTGAPTDVTATVRAIVTGFPTGLSF
jgi:hypothetical protein